MTARRFTLHITESPLSLHLFQVDVYEQRRLNDRDWTEPVKTYNIMTSAKQLAIDQAIRHVLDRAHGSAEQYDVTITLRELDPEPAV